MAGFGFGVDRFGKRRHSSLSNNNNILKLSSNALADYHYSLYILTFLRYHFCV